MSYSQDLSCLAFQALWGQAPWDSVERGRPPQGTVFHRERFYLILLVSEQSPRDRESPSSTFSIGITSPFRTPSSVRNHFNKAVILLQKFVIKYP